MKRGSVAILGVLALIAGCVDQRAVDLTRSVTTIPPTTTTTAPSTTTTRPTTTTVLQTTTTTLVAPDGLTAAQRHLVEVATITGAISPKSVVTSGQGLFFAQNMMYRHTITVYDRDFELVAAIEDRVDPTEHGFGEFGEELAGSPVEVAFDSDGSHAYVSNYKMYGGGLDTSAGDGCNPGSWPDSFVYRVDTGTLDIDRLIRVGPVPKFLAVTPDDRLLVVSNWCGFDVSIVDLESGTELARVPVGRHPRGVAISPDSATAYVAVMGSTRIAVIDLFSLEVGYIEGVGRSPRHLVISPDGQTLYVSLNGDGRIAKLDLVTRDVTARVATGSAPRSMAISDDGTALYVVNYNSDTMSKVRTEDMVETEEHRTGHHPIGITYDPPSRQVWIANYSGTIQVFADTAP
jgi:YVTN family beta-propeller protein